VLYIASNTAPITDVLAGAASYPPAQSDAPLDPAAQPTAHGSKPISPEFFQFLTSLGWPVRLVTSFFDGTDELRSVCGALSFFGGLTLQVQLAAHPGYKGDLDASFCPTAPYYSDLFTEVMFHVPCLMSDALIGSRPTSTAGAVSSLRSTASRTSTYAWFNTRLSLTR